jgi:hypothetical protein
LDLFFLLFCSFSSLLFNFFLFISSYILNCLRLLIFFSSYILNCLLYCRHEISVILRGFSRGQGFFDPFEIKINVYGATMRPNFFVLSFFNVF